MSKAEENRKSLKIKLLEARLKSYYNRVKSMHDYALKISLDNLTEVQQFLELTSNLSVLRTEFNNEFDELTLIKMDLSPESEPNMTALEAFENLFVAVHSKVNALSSPSIGNSNANGPSVRTAPRMNLPPVELPKFDGSTKSWPMFIECFNNMIHRNAQLSNGDKVYYLCGQLKDRALETIAGIAPTGENYELMYSTLVNKYQDVRSLGTAYLEEMFNLKKMIAPSVDGLNSFMAKFSVSVSAFEKLEIPNRLDFVYLYLALKKVDCETARLFENSVRDEKIPSYGSFAKFVREQAKIIERTGVYTSTGSGKNSSTSFVRVPVPVNSGPSAGRTTRALFTASLDCPVCKRSDHDHFSRCVDFLNLATRERYNIVKQNNGCVLCLSFGHKANACNVKGSCDNCHSRTHHSLLHFDGQTSTALPVSGDVQDIEGMTGNNDREIDVKDAGVSLCSSQEVTAHSSVIDSTTTTVLLATARVRVIDSSGNVHLVRCLIDNGSQNHFITNKCCKRLCLGTRMLPSPKSVHGFGGSSNHVTGETELEFCSRFDRSRPYKICPLVVGSITQCLPTSVIDRSKLNYSKGVPLADYTFDCPGEIEMLIGAQLFSRLILSGRIYGPPGRPDALQTTLGFIVMGEAPVASQGLQNHTSAFCTFSRPCLEEVVDNFLELEEVSSCSSAEMSLEEQECEQYYQSTTTRDSDGRYMVGLPFKSDSAELGSSLHVAEESFLSLERKFRVSMQLRDVYDKRVRECLEFGYLSLVGPASGDVGYVLPHHAVIRDEKVTTELRMVLDSSARTDKGLKVTLLCVKSRVAPLALARLELCGALLLAKLVRSVQLTYDPRWKIDRIYAFIDSTVALYWIHASPHRWKTFVANRVARIQECLHPNCFDHNAGKGNPSDCLSRGLTPARAELIEHPLWLEGLPWMSQVPTSWPVQPFYPVSTDIPEAKPEVVLVTLDPIKLVHKVVYILRFVRKLKTRGLPLPPVKDLAQAELAVLLSLQTVYFAEGIEAVKTGKSCTDSPRRLRPVMVDGILWVRGQWEKFEKRSLVLLRVPWRVLPITFSLN